MKYNVLLIAILLSSNFITAQKTYFQQDLAYTIRVSLDDTKHELNAFETIIYKNNSPDTLSFIYMHLWPNAYKSNKTALGKQLKEDGNLFFNYTTIKDRGYIDSLDFKVDGQAVKFDYVDGNLDIAKIILNSPLKSGSQIEITTPFHVKLPSGKISRLGHIDQQYQITQWYPKPAVYDKNGWQEIPYLTQGEFYSEFGTFDVFITIPKNYVLGSTGDLIDNPEEVLFMDSIASATKLINKYDTKDNSFPVSSKQTKTLHYRQSHIHDFAWFCDKRYHVLKGEVELPHTKNKVTTWVMYTNQYANAWKDAIAYVNDALFYYSKWNGDYTYDVCTAVDGALSAGGGMEYPNITVIGAVPSPLLLDIVITHEVGHNWFYGMLGSNERVHGWMDEGINSANELRYVETKYPNRTLLEVPNKLLKMFDLAQYKRSAQYYLGFTFCAKTNSDQPIETHSADFVPLNYGTIMYMKSAVVFDYLRSYLGDSLYDNCFQTYFDKWYWKHPMPEDIRTVFEQTSGKNLSWFFEDLIQTTKQMDYKICSVPTIKDPEKKIKDEIVVIVKNTGEIKAPVCIHAMKNKIVLKTIWYEGFTGKADLLFPKGDCDEISIDQLEKMPEINRKNNTIYTHGILRKVEPLKIQLAGSLDNPKRTQLFWMPTVGFNSYDKLMVGTAIYNHVMPGKKLEWCAMPMYSSGDKSLVGHADASYTIYPKNVFRNICIGVNANRYNFYKIQSADLPLGGRELNKRLGFIKVAPEINFDLQKSYARSPISQQILLRAIYLKTNKINEEYDLDGGSTWSVGNVERTFYEVSYLFKNNRSLNAYNFVVKFQSGDFMNKLQATGNYKININAKKIINVRVFAGTFLGNTSTGDYRFRMSSWGTSGNNFAMQDYLFDNILLGRSQTSGLLSHQMITEDGGFKVFSTAGQSNSWLTAINFILPMPFKSKLLSIINFYGDFGVCNTNPYSVSANKNIITSYGAGIQLVLGPCFVYIPLLVSPDIKDYNLSNDIKFPNLIRFELNLKKINPFQLIKNIDLQ